MSVKSDQKTPSIDPQVLKQLLAGKKTAGEIEDLLKDLRKAFIEHALQGELTDLLGYPKHQAEGRNSGNSRNGYSRKRVKTDESEIEVEVPRDRNGQFEPQLIAKRQTRWDGFDETILALYARGMSTRDIQSFLKEKYDVPVTPEFVSNVCESVSVGVQEWRTRLLAGIWPILYVDALFLKVRDEGRVISKALYVAVGVNLEGPFDRSLDVSALDHLHIPEFGNQHSRVFDFDILRNSKRLNPAVLLFELGKPGSFVEKSSERSLKVLDRLLGNLRWNLVQPFVFGSLFHPGDLFLNLPGCDRFSGFLVERFLASESIVVGESRSACEPAEPLVLLFC
jgi:hypothetical protein